MSKRVKQDASDDMPVPMDVDDPKSHAEDGSFGQQWSPNGGHLLARSSGSAVASGLNDSLFGQQLAAGSQSRSSPKGGHLIARSSGSLVASGLSDSLLGQQLAAGSQSRSSPNGGHLVASRADSSANIGDAGAPRRAEPAGEVKDLLCPARFMQSFLEPASSKVSCLSCRL